MLAVPSAIVPRASNYLLNPLHLAFKRIKIGKPSSVETDLRLRSNHNVYAQLPFLFNGKGTASFYGAPSPQNFFDVALFAP